MSLQVLRCLFVPLLLLSLRGFGDALGVDEKKNSENYAGKRNIFFNINSLSAKQSLSPLKSVGATQNFAFRGKIPFRKRTSKSVVDRLRNQITSQKNKNKSQRTLHVIGSARNLVSCLGIKIRMILRHLMQPVVKKYFALTKKLPIQHRLSLVKDKTNNFQFKSNKLSRDSTKNEVSSVGKVLKIEISTPVDKKFPNANKFKSGQRIAAALGFSDSPTKRLHRRSLHQYLTKDILPRRSSELGGDEPKENMLKSLQSSKELASILPASEDHHVPGFFLDKNFMMGVSYFVNHPDKMLSPDAPGIVGIGKLRPTKPPSTSTTMRLIVKAVGNKALVSDRSRYIAGSSEDEIDIIHEYTKTVKSHKSRKNYEQGENSVNIPVRRDHIHTFSYNKQSKMGRQDLTQTPLLLMSSLQTPEIASHLPAVEVNDNYANEITFSTQVYPQSQLPEQVINFLSRQSNHTTTQPYSPGTYYKEYTISVLEKPSHPQQFISDSIAVVPENPHNNYRTFYEYNLNPFLDLNSIDSSSIFFENDQSKAPYSQLHQQLDNLNINIFSKGERSSGNLKELVQEKTYQLHPPFSNVPTITRAAQRPFPEAYNYDDITNMYGPHAGRFWNHPSSYRAFTSPALYSYGNWRNERIPVVSAF